MLEICQKKKVSVNNQPFLMKTDLVRILIHIVYTSSYTYPGPLSESEARSRMAREVQQVAGQKPASPEYPPPFPLSKHAKSQKNDGQTGSCA